MNIIKIILEHKDGTLFYVDNIKDIETIIKTIPRIKFKKTGSRSDLIRKYKTQVGIFAKERGYTKESLDLALKPLLYTRFTDYPEYFINPNLQLNEKHSCTNLTLQGLDALITNLNDFINDLKI